MNALATVPPPDDRSTPDALSFANVSVSYRVDGRECDVLHDLTLRIRPGEAYGLVGESGSGKSTAALAAVRYLPRGGKQRRGHIHIAGVPIDTLSATALRHLRAHQVSMIYQDAGSALNPAMTVGRQLIEAFEIACTEPGMRRAEFARQAASMLERVRIDSPSQVMRQYPHQLSGGMQQRVVIAMALASRPTLLILDEPTTGLDSTVEAEVLSLLREIRDEASLSMLFISHNLAVVASICDRVGILYAGELVEEGTTQQVLGDSQHPYTVSLLRCLPAGHSHAETGGLATIPGSLPPLGRRADACAFAERCGLARPACFAAAPPLYLVHATGEHRSRCFFYQEASALPVITSASDRPPHRPPQTSPDTGATGLRVVRVSKTFDSAHGTVHALDDVSFALRPGETLGLVGESGSGKSTLAKVLLGLEAPDEGGAIELNGQPLPQRVTARSPDQIRAMQIVFQHPDAALNRAWSVRQLVSRSIRKLMPVRTASHRGREGAVAVGPVDMRLNDLLAAVRLAPRFLHARVASLSGGLKQRVAIARAFAGDPQIVICDEPTSALDVSVQAAILNLLTELQRRQGVSYLFISHDLEVVRYLADRIAVLYRGRIVEIGPARDVLSGPHHPYTAELVAAARMHALSSETAAATTASAMPPSTSAGPSVTHAQTPRAKASLAGCVFAPRCPLFIGDICAHERPVLSPIDGEHALACHLSADRLPRVLQARAPERHEGARNTKKNGK